MVFADEDSRDEYLADPEKTNLILGVFDAPFNYAAEITLLSQKYTAVQKGTLNNFIDFMFQGIVKNDFEEPFSEPKAITDNLKSPYLQPFLLRKSRLNVCIVLFRAFNFQIKKRK